MTNFDRLGAKDSAEKQKQLANTPDVTKQLEAGIKAAGLDQQHDARLIQLKYITPGGRNYDANLVGEGGKFDLTKQTNVETDRHGRPKTELVKNDDDTMTERVETDGNPGVKEFLQPFVDIKNVFGQGFLDHALYDYNIPYGQLEQFSKELKSIDQALKQGLIRLTAEEERTLLAELQVGPVDKEKFLNTQQEETFHAKEFLPATGLESPRDKKILEAMQGRIEKYHNLYLNELHTVFGKDSRMDADTASNLSRGIASYGMNQLYTQVRGQLKDPYNDAQLASLVESPKIQNGIWNSQRAPFLLALKEVKECNGIDGSKCEFSSFSQLTEFSSPDACKAFLEKGVFANPKDIVLTEKNPAITSLLPVKNTQQSFKNMFDLSQKATPATQTEALLSSTGPFVEGLTGGIGKVADYVTGFVDQLKASGSREKVEKIRNLLFGDGDILDRLSAFNKMKETNLPSEKTLALEQGFSLIKGLPTGDNLEYLKIKGAMETSLFPQTAFDGNLTDGERGKVVSDAATALGGGTYDKLLSGEPKVADIMDVSMRAMCAKDSPPYAGYVPYKEARDTGNAAAAQSLFLTMFRKTADAFDLSSKDKKLGTKPNETFARSLLATILDTPDAGNGMITAATNDVQKSIDVARGEIDKLTKDMSMHLVDNKLMITGIASTDVVGIKVGSAEPNVYTPAGIDLLTLGTPPEFTLVKQEAGPKWSSLIKMEDISVLAPQVDKSPDGTKFTLGGLAPTVKYDAKTTYTKDNADKQFDGEITGPAVAGGKVDHPIVADNGTPKEIRVKPKIGGLRQTIWKS